MKYKVTCSDENNNIDELFIETNGEETVAEIIAREITNWYTYGDDFNIKVNKIEVPDICEFAVTKSDNKYIKIVVEPLPQVEDITNDVINEVKILMNELEKSIEKNIEKRERQLLDELKRKYEPQASKKECSNNCTCRSCDK